MAQSAYEKLNARVEELVNNRGNTDSTLQEISDNLFGSRDFRTMRTPGQDRMQRIFDDTSKISASLLAGAMHSLMTSPAARWFEFQFENPEFRDLREAAVWLDLVETRIYAALGAPQANFHASLSETYIDLIGFGTGGLFVDDVPGTGIQFSARPLQELYLAEDPSGRVDTVIRKFEFTSAQAVMQWGDKAKAAQAAINGNDFETKHEYAHIIMPREKVEIGNIDASGMPWASFHLSLADRAIMDEGGFQEMPMATPRWSKEPGEVYGRGPGWNALSNQKMLNEMKRVKLSAAQLSIMPPLMVDSDAVVPGELSLHPGALWTVNSVMSSLNPPVQPIQLGGDSRMTTEDIIDARKSVQDAFLHQLVEVIRDPRMTATQVLELSAQMQRHMAPILGRMQTELLEPVLERVFAIESRAGRLPPAPDAISGQAIRINYVSPVARAQQTSDARAMLDYGSAVIGMSEAVPGVLDNVDFDAIARELAEAFGVPSIAVKDPRAVESKRAAERKLAEEQAQIEQAVTATDQIAKIAKASPQQGA